MSDITTAQAWLHDLLLFYPGHSLTVVCGSAVIGHCPDDPVGTRLVYVIDRRSWRGLLWLRRL